MDQSRSALMLHREEELLGPISFKLERQFIRTTRAHGCAEALEALRRPNPPQLIVTDLTAMDGDWADVLKLTAKSPVPVNIIVVADQVNMQRYFDCMEAGAFDFIVPPVPDAGLRFVIDNAAADVVARRAQLPRNA